MNASFILLALLDSSFAAEPKHEELEKVRAALVNTNVEARRTAIKHLIHSDLSAPLYPEMLVRLKDVDDEVRLNAATAIGNLGAKAESALPALIAQLENDKFKEARETAARALGRIGKAAPANRSAVKPLRRAAERDADAVTRTVALGALAMMDEDVPAQVSALRKFLSHEEPLVRMKASHALGMIGAPAKVAAPEIVKVLEKETDSHRRGYIARALGNTGDPQSLPALEKALKNESDPGAQGEMRGAMQRLSAKK